MQYKYRWWYVLSLISGLFIGAYFYVLHPIASSLKQLREMEKNLVETLSSTKTAFKQSRSPSLSTETAIASASLDVISALFRLIHQHGLEMVSTYQIAQETDAELTLNISLRGHFTQLNDFLFALHRYIYPMRITTFSYEMDKEATLLLKATIVILKTPEHFSRIMPKRQQVVMQFPFCTSPGFLSATINEGSKKRLAYSVALLKTAGFLRQGTRHEALLRLPTQEVVAVEVGMLVGEESALIEKIDGNQVSVRLPDGKQMILKMPLNGM